MRPRALDLYCGAGGASEGLARAGFEVFGIDLARQPHYPHWFRQGDALAAELEGFAFVWASPPCQRFSSATRHYDRDKSPDLIAPTRELLEASGALYCIENVPRAPIRPDLILQGDMFGLGVVRRRHFELNFDCPAPAKLTSGRGLVKDGAAITVAGGGEAGCIEAWSEAMGIDWPMTRRQLVNAIPPAYAQWIGMKALGAIADARGRSRPSEHRSPARPSDPPSTDRQLRLGWPNDLQAEPKRLGGYLADNAQVLPGQVNGSRVKD